MTPTPPLLPLPLPPLLLLIQKPLHLLLDIIHQPPTAPTPPMPPLLPLPPLPIRLLHPLLLPMLLDPPLQLMRPIRPRHQPPQRSQLPVPQLLPQQAPRRRPHSRAAPFLDAGV